MIDEWLPNILEFPPSLQKLECLPKGRRHGDLVVHMVKVSYDHESSHNKDELAADWSKLIAGQK
jgi:hypothetical protein